MLIGSNNKGEITKAKAKLNREFEIKDLRATRRILGM